MDDDVFFEQNKKNKYIWTIVISNPGKKNSLTPAILNKISVFLRKDNVRRTARAIIICGDGAEAFSAGYDITQIKKPGVTRENEASATILLGTIQEIKDFPAPIISMINGFCIGAGLHLAVSTDIRIASEDSRMGITPAKIGLLYHPDGILDFINLIGTANTRELFYTGNLYNAGEAKAIGMVNKIVPSAELEEAAYSMAGQISSNAPLSVQGTKYAIKRYIDSFAMNADVRNEIIKLREKVFLSADIKEGKFAFEEKRKPVFHGR